MAIDVFDLFAKIGLDSTEFQKGLNNAKSNMSSFGSAMSSGFATVAKVGAAAFTATTGAATVFAKSAVEAGKDFDGAMSQVAATMGVTTNEITELRDFAKEMGATTTFSATQSAEALNYMALAGYDAEKSMSMLPNVLNLAASGGMELATASDMVTDAQSALGLSMEETTKLVDKMAKTASSSNTSVAQLGEAILQIGGSAKKLKGSTTELTTILGILADNGMKGAEGGTHLRNMLNSLMSPTKDATAMMEELGVSLYDSEGNMRSLNDVFIDLRNGMNSLATQAERDQVVTSIFNARDMKAAEALLAGVGDRYEELSGKIDEAAGAAQDMANTQLDNLTGDITLFNSALEGTKIAISDKLTPTLRKFTKFGGESLQELTEALEKDGFEGAINKLGDVIDDAFDLLDDVAPKALEAGAKLTGRLIAGIAKKSPDIIREGVRIATVLGNTIAQQAPEIIESSIAAFTTLGTEVYDNMIVPAWDFIVNKLPGLINDRVKKLDFTKVGDFISRNVISGFEGISEFVDNIDWGEVGNKLGEAMNSIDWSGIIKAAVKAFTSVVKNAPDLIAGFANALDGESQAVLVAYVFAPKFISAVASKLASSNLFMSLTGKAEAAGTAASASFATKFSLGVGAFFAGWSIGTLIREQIGEENIDEFLEPAFENIEAGWKTYGEIWDALERNGARSFDSIDQDITRLKGEWELWTESFNEVMDTYREGFEQVRLSLKPIGQWFVDQERNLEHFGGWVFDAKEKVVQFATDWRTTFESAGSKVNDVVTEFKDNWDVGARAIWSGIDSMSKKWDSFKDIISSGVSTIGTKLDEVGNFFGNIGTSIKNLVDSAWQWGYDLVSNFISGVKSLGNEWTSTFEGLGADIYDYLHHSHPDKGPLADDYKWMPDMMDSFTKGIKDNAYKPIDAIDSMVTDIHDSFSQPFTGNVNGYTPFSSMSGMSGVSEGAKEVTLQLVDGAYNIIARGVAKPLDIINGRNITLATRGRQT